MVETMQLSGRHCPLDGCMRVAKLSKLTNRDDAMLPVRENRQLPPPRQRFYTHSGNKLCRA
jgi:hypothetical protein